jgi:hypothetical protein
MVGIDQQLDGNISDGLYAANNPSTGNPIATMADLTGGGGGILPADEWYILQQNFDRGVIPQGWTQSTSAPPATVSYTQPYETNAIGQVLLSAPGPAALFASVAFANGYNHILNFSDCLYTKWNSRVKRNPTNVGVALVGLANVIGTAVPSVFGNVIALIHDPGNMTGANPGLLTNWLVWVKDASGQSIYDTLVAPDNLWQYVEFEYNYVGVPFVEVKIGGVVVATVPNTDVNLFVSEVAGVGAGVKPVCYCGKTIAATGGNQFAVNQFNLYRKWI